MAATAAQNAATADTTPGSPATPTPTLAAGTTLAERYTIDRLLGRGGMGAVYAAHDALIDRDVAIKLVTGHTSTEQLREEMRASLELTHRNIARTYTLDTTAAGEPFIVMELIPGKTLAARIAAGKVPLVESLEIIDQLLVGLAHAHAHGVVHRDVKPANIMLADDGRVVLMDFGLARTDDDTRTHTTSIKGTPAYMAPETISGRRADARADLYAVGLILFEMVTGEPPFKAATARELLHRHLHDPIADLRSHPHLGRIITRLAAKDPAERYASADEVRAALAEPTPRRRPTLAFAIGAAILAAALGTGLLASRFTAHEAVPPPSHMDRAHDLFERGVRAADAKHFLEAAEWFRQATVEYPDEIFVFNAAASYEQAGRIDDAVYYYKRYLALAKSGSAHDVEWVRARLRKFGADDGSATP
jgi:predicted Ser/Thr protein kinase